jgi:thiol:disulfide interchange protein
MKPLLILTALIEAATGLALLVVPVFVVKLLLGAEISGAAIPLGRVAGIALLALGVACWLAGNDSKNRAAKGLVVAMLVYNFGVAIILAVAAIQSHLVGIALWPAVILHVAMGVWNIRVAATSA